MGVMRLTGFLCDEYNGDLFPTRTHLIRDISGAGFFVRSAANA